MSLDLDDETLAALGWGTDATDSTTHYVSAPKPSRIAPGDIDGRSRRNWRRKAASRLALRKAAPDAAPDTVSRYNAHRSQP